MPLPMPPNRATAPRKRQKSTTPPPPRSPPPPPPSPLLPTRTNQPGGAFQWNGAAGRGGAERWIGGMEQRGGGSSGMEGVVDVMDGWSGGMEQRDGWSGGIEGVVGWDGVGWMERRDRASGGMGWDGWDGWSGGMEGAT